MKKKKTTEVQRLKSQLVRALADYDNLTKRIEREKSEFTKVVNLALLARLLPVVDILEVAQRHLTDSGLAIAIKEFKEVLEEEGVFEIESKKGTKFDEKRHEAVETVKGSKAGKIAETILAGWKFEDGVTIRPAKVKVYKK